MTSPGTGGRCSCPESRPPCTSPAHKKSNTSSAYKHKDGATDKSQTLISSSLWLFANPPPPPTSPLLQLKNLSRSPTEKPWLQQIKVSSKIKVTSTEQLQHHHSLKRPGCQGVTKGHTEVRLSEAAWLSGCDKGPYRSQTLWSGLVVRVWQRAIQKSDSLKQPGCQGVTKGHTEVRLSEAEQSCYYHFPHTIVLRLSWEQTTPSAQSCYYHFPHTIVLQLSWEQTTPSAQSCYYHFPHTIVLQLSWEQTTPSAQSCYYHFPHTIVYNYPENRQHPLHRAVLTLPAPQPCMSTRPPFLLHVFHSHNSHFQHNGGGGRHRGAGFCRTGFCGSSDSRSAGGQSTDRSAWPGRWGPTCCPVADTPRPARTGCQTRSGRENDRYRSGCLVTTSIKSINQHQQNWHTLGERMSGTGQVPWLQQIPLNQQ